MNITLQAKPFFGHLIYLHLSAVLINERPLLNYRLNNFVQKSVPTRFAWICV